MSIQFVAIDSGGKETDWIDPVRKIEVDDTSFFVHNDAGAYVVDFEDGCRYELRAVRDDG